MSTLTVLLLLVEDDDHIQEILDMALTEAGFEVLAASNGIQAIAELDANAARFRAVITDINLGQGRPDGWAVARHARELVHEMSVVYMSASDGHDWASQGVPNSIMISKPFAPAQIVTAVSTLLNAAPVTPSSP